MGLVAKIVLGVVLGLVVFTGACVALIGGAANEAVQDLDKLTEPADSAIARVEAPTGVCWSGAIGNATRDGCGPAEFDITAEGTGGIYSVNAQKQGEGSEPLTLVLVINGEEVDRAETTAAYGVVSVDNGE